MLMSCDTTIAKCNDMDIGLAGSTLDIGTGNACASRTGPDPNIP